MKVTYKTKHINGETGVELVATFSEGTKEVIYAEHNFNQQGMDEGFKARAHDAYTNVDTVRQ